jgi:hypothetical protein
MKTHEPIAVSGWVGAWPADWRDVFRIEEIREFGVVMTARAEEPIWIPGMHSRVHRWQAAWCFGCPFQCLGSIERNEGIMPVGGTPIAVPSWVDRGLGDIGKASGDIRHLPLRPIWLGFALNTLFYAALAWGLWQVPLALRRRSRSKKGLCVRCGYDLKGLGGSAAGRVCPECGTTVGV